MVEEVSVDAEFLDEVEGDPLDADPEHLDHVRVVQLLHYLRLLCKKLINLLIKIDISI